MKLDLGQEPGLRLQATGSQVRCRGRPPWPVNLGLAYTATGVRRPSMSLQVALRTAIAIYADRYHPTLAPAFNPRLT